ncbi:MAG: TolC family protein, partial [Bacteroidota bacterium]
LTANALAQESNSVLSLEQAINQTLANNFDIKIERFNQEADANSVSKAVAGQLPTLNLSLGYEFGYSNAEIQTLGGEPGNPSPPLELDGTAQTFNFSPEISIPVFSGFRHRYQYKQLQVAEKSSTALVQQTIERSISKTVSLYLETARLQAQLSISEEILEISRDRHLRMVESARYGASNSLARLQAEVDLKTDSANYRNLRLMYKNSIRNLNLQMGQQPDIAYRVTEKISLTNVLSYEDLKKKMLANNSLIHVSRLRVENANHQTEIAKSYIAPNISGYANYTYLNSENEANFLRSQRVSGPNVGVRMSWRLYDGGTSKIQRQNAAVRLSQQQTSLQYATLQLETELKNIFNQYLTGREQLRIERSNLATYQLNYDKTAEDFRLGQADASDLRSAQLNLSSARNRINDLVYDIKQSEVRLLELSGELQLNIAK